MPSSVEETADVHDSSDPQRKIDNDIDASESSNQANQSDQMVIYNGDISMEVEDYHHTHLEIQKRINELNGYVVESSVHQYGKDSLRNGTIVARVPQEHFQTFIYDVESTSSNVIEKSIRGNDVTKEYVDLEARLSSKKIVEERLISFMDQADNTESLLHISNDLSDVQEEIERIRGQMNYLENHVALSTVTIQIHERSSQVPSIQARESLNTLEQTQRLFMNTINFIITFFSKVFVFLVGLSPVIVPITLVAVVLFYNRKKLTNKSKQ